MANTDKLEKKFQKLKALRNLLSLEIDELEEAILERNQKNNSEVELIGPIGPIGLISPINPINPISQISPIGPISSDNLLNSEIRQKAIFDKIRQLSASSEEGCGLRNLIEAFPDVSDRTLRYDLQKLIMQELIVKVGNRGPNTSYRCNKKISGSL